MSPQIIGAEFKPPPTWNESYAHTLSELGCAMVNERKSRLEFE